MRKYSLRPVLKFAMVLTLLSVPVVVAAGTPVGGAAAVLGDVKAAPVVVTSQVAAYTTGWD